MTVNVAVNGLHLYQHVMAPLAGLVPLGRFYYAHRRSTTAARLGLAAEQVRNFWFKEYLLNAHLRWLPPRDSSLWHTRYGDIWQAQVLRDWQPADHWLMVIGELADRLMARARAEGARVIGHAVTSHPNAFAGLINEERDRLGLGHLVDPVRVGSRRLAEIEQADHMLVMSEFARRGFIEAGFPDDRVSVAHPGIDLSRFHPLRPDERPDPLFRVVCVGQIGLRKGQHYLLEAWRRLRLPNAELLLVGGLAREAPAILAPYEGLFRHIPHIPNHQLRDRLARASLFVLPTIEDGFAQVVAEAQACGLPVITTHNAGAADLIESGVTGYVLSPRDINDLADHIRLLYEGADQRRRMAAAAAHSAHGRIDGWMECAQRMATLLGADLLPQEAAHATAPH